MTTNMGKIDRGLRLAVAAVLLILAFATQVGGEGWLKWVMVAVAAVFIVTSLAGNCPLYSIIGIRTCRG
jgi:NhaP-type Na+/H+ and K+/H+ antiporter